jgi:hypothetical protein
LAWARAAFAAVLGEGEVPEALLGLASACYWLGDLPGMMQSLERAYAAARRRPDPVLAAAAAAPGQLDDQRHGSGGAISTQLLAIAAPNTPDRRLCAVHRVSVWCDRIAQNALFWSSRLRETVLELAGFDARLSLCGFQPVKVSTAWMNLAASWNQKAWPASS